MSINYDINERLFSEHPAPSWWRLPDDLAKTLIHHITQIPFTPSRPSMLLWDFVKSVLDGTEYDCAKYKRLRPLGRSDTLSCRVYLSDTCSRVSILSYLDKHRALFDSAYLGLTRGKAAKLVNAELSDWKRLTYSNDAPSKALIGKYADAPDLKSRVDAAWQSVSDHLEGCPNGVGDDSYSGGSIDCLVFIVADYYIKSGYIDDARRVVRCNFNRLMNAVIESGYEEYTKYYGADCDRQWNGPYIFPLDSVRDLISESKSSPAYIELALMYFDVFDKYMRDLPDQAKYAKLKERMAGVEDGAFTKGIIAACRFWHAGNGNSKSRISPQLVNDIDKYYSKHLRGTAPLGVILMADTIPALPYEYSAPTAAAMVSYMEQNAMLKRYAFKMCKCYYGYNYGSERNPAKWLLMTYDDMGEGMRDRVAKLAASYICDLPRSASVFDSTLDKIRFHVDDDASGDITDRIGKRLTGDRSDLLAMYLLK